MGNRFPMAATWLVMFLIASNRQLHTGMLPIAKGFEYIRNYNIVYSYYWFLLINHYQYSEHINFSGNFTGPILDCLESLAMVVANCL